MGLFGRLLQRLDDGLRIQDYDKVAEQIKEFALSPALDDFERERLSELGTTTEMYIAERDFLLIGLCNATLRHFAGKSDNLKLSMASSSFSNIIEKYLMQRAGIDADQAQTYMSRICNKYYLAEPEVTAGRFLSALSDGDLGEPDLVQTPQILDLVRHLLRKTLLFVQRNLAELS